MIKVDRVDLIGDDGAVEFLLLRDLALRAGIKAKVDYVSKSTAQRITHLVYGKKGYTAKYK